jgi:hypothetical protein
MESQIAVSEYPSFGFGVAILEHFGDVVKSGSDRATRYICSCRPESVGYVVMAVIPVIAGLGLLLARRNV